MRVTRKMLECRIANLNRVLNRPATSWTRVECDGRNISHANVGHFLLDSYSPGDGWTRYRLMMIATESGGEFDISPCCTAQELAAYLRGVFDVLDSQFMCDGGKHTFDKYPKGNAA